MKFSEWEPHVVDCEGHIVRVSHYHDLPDTVLVLRNKADNLALAHLIVCAGRERCEGCVEALALLSAAILPSGLPA